MCLVWLVHIDLDTRNLKLEYQADICIIGGGIAGILLASRLGSAGKLVHLLEAGGLDLEHRSQDLYRTEMGGQPHAGATEGRFRTFGGSSTRWGGQLLPYTEDVLHPDSRIGLPRWPIELAEIEPYYTEVQRVMGVSTYPFSDDLLKEFMQEVPFRSSRVRLRFSKCAPFAKRNLSKTVGKECIDARTIMVFTHANVLSINLNTTGTAALGVTATNYGGERYRFMAKEVVVCTGTIEASRLLLASTAVCPEGVGNCRGQVGRYFHDHVGVRAAEIGPDDRTRVIQAFAPYVRGGTSYRAKLEATAELRREQGLLSVAGQFTIEEPTGSGAEVVRRVLREFQQGQVSLDLWWDVLGVPALSKDLVGLWVTARFRSRRYVSKSAKVVLDLDVEQRPDSESRIRLGRETDALGMRKAVVDWRVCDDERETLRCYAEVLKMQFRDMGLGSIQWKPQLAAEGDAWRSGYKMDTFHMMGGTRMGSDPATSVVDSSLRVHGIRNLSVVSCSVFPTGGSSNPTFTMMALALRLADRLQTR